MIEDQARCAAEVWRQPDQGIWECRGEPHHYVSSKVMCWVALDRAARLAARRGYEGLADEWRLIANEIHADVLANGVDSRGVFTQHYETEALDASNLLVPLVRFMPQGDERVRATVLAIADELTENGLVLRYRTDETDDGLEGEEGTFLICSFWLVSALLEIGERKRGRELCERLLKDASPLGLYAEELESASGRHLGNFPQAFTHLALINAVTHVIRDERRDAEPLRGPAPVGDTSGEILRFASGLPGRRGELDGMTCACLPAEEVRSDSLAGRRHICLPVPYHRAGRRKRTRSGAFRRSYLSPRPPPGGGSSR